jgi:hypothetical protein
MACREAAVPVFFMNALLSKTEKFQEMSLENIGDFSEKTVYRGRGCFLNKNKS